MFQFTAPALGALMHEMAYELDPARRWNAFLGGRHTIVTSWVGVDVGGVDFGFRGVDFGFSKGDGFGGGGNGGNGGEKEGGNGGGGGLRMVDPLMPECDGW